jgi:O-antigen/teichoic acid export membrane protein
MNRTKNYLSNAFFSLLLNFVLIVFGFVIRRLFILNLGLEYAGVYSLFNNLVSIFSLSELGVGAALTYQLYRPLKEKSIEKLSALFHFYRKAYIRISAIIVVIGVIFSPFLGLILSTSISSNEVLILYYLVIFNTSLSYFMGYYKSILIADQKSKFVSKINLILYLFQSSVQFFMLIIFSSFLLYLLTSIFFSFFINFYTRKKVLYLYPYLKNSLFHKLSKADEIDVKKSIMSMALHKFGSVLVTSTDSLMISSFISIITVGLYSNYLLLIETTKRLINLLMENLTPSIGGLVNEQNLLQSKRIFYEITFFNFILNFLTTVSYFSFVQLFIVLWLGEVFLISNTVISLLSLSLYLNLSRRANIVFIDATGVFNNLKYKSFIEGLLNLFFSLFFVLGFDLGLSGIVLGTILSNVFSNIFIEPLYLFKYYFKQNLDNEFFIRFFFNILITSLNLTSFIFFRTFIFKNPFFIDHFFSYLISLILSLIVIFIFYYKKQDFKDLSRRISYVKTTIKF